MLINVAAWLWLAVALFVSACGQEASFQETISASRQEALAEERKKNAAGAADAEVAEVDAGMGNGSGEDDPEGFGAITRQELAARCAAAAPLSLQQTIVFDQPADTCAWGTDQSPNNGNLGPRQGRVSARLEQDVSLNLPRNALICGLDFDFSPSNEQGQQMYYDDEIFLNMNNVILAASQSYESVFAKKDGFLFYDWKNLVGKRYGSRQFKPYCAGGQRGKGKCFIPPTETSGKMRVDFSDEIVQAIVIASTSNQPKSDRRVLAVQDPFVFSFVTVGDNDSPIDCKHSRFEVDVKARFILPD